MKSKPWDLKVWKEKRKEIINDKSICEYCGIKKDLIIHHPYKYKKWEDYSELKDTENILILCKGCHLKLHKFGIKLCSKCKKKNHKIKYNYCYVCNQEEEKEIMAGVEEIEEEEDKMNNLKGGWLIP